MASLLHRYDVAVIGGGLSGLCAALRLGQSRVRTVLLDSTVNSTDRALGGFARFSGAKFSLPPAGLGLLPIVGSSERLFEIVDQVISLLSIDYKQPTNSTDLRINLKDIELSKGVFLRNYDSIVLTPSEINQVIDNLEKKVRTHSHVINAKCTSLTRNATQWHIKYLARDNIEELVSKVVFFCRRPPRF